MKRTPIDQLKLRSTASNLKRELKRRAKDVEMSRTLELNIRQVNSLIQMLYKECRKVAQSPTGSVLRGTKKRHPAFSNLSLMLRVRETLERNKKQREPKPAKPADASKSFAQFIGDPPLLVPERTPEDAA
jgi:hypothetical protein